MDSLGTLLSDPLFSDLVLRCDGQEFHVHKCIISVKSPVFAAACIGNSQFAHQKAMDGVIDVTDVSAPILARVIAFFYSGDYNDAETPSENQEDKDTTGIHECTHDIDQEDPHEDMRKTLPEATVQIATSNKQLITNVSVHVAANLYQVPKLLELAVMKFRKAAASFSKNGFVDVAASVYNSRPAVAQELKDILGDQAVEHASILLTDEAFMSAIEVVPAFMKDFMQLLFQENGRTTEALRTSICNCSTELKETEALLAGARKDHKLALQAKEEEEKQGAEFRHMVNNAKQCRHCGLDNNVYFEFEIGRKYTLRCSCRTRY